MPTVRYTRYSRPPQRREGKGFSLSQINTKIRQPADRAVEPMTRSRQSHGECKKSLVLRAICPLYDSCRAKQEGKDRKHELTRHGYLPQRVRCEFPSFFCVPAISVDVYGFFIYSLYHGLLLSLSFCSDETERPMNMESQRKIILFKIRQIISQHAQKRSHHFFSVLDVFVHLQAFLIYRLGILPPEPGSFGRGT